VEAPRIPLIIDIIRCAACAASALPANTTIETDAAASARREPERALFTEGMASLKIPSPIMRSPPRAMALSQSSRTARDPAGG
jgi:hypothetical protein